MGIFLGAWLAAVSAARSQNGEPSPAPDVAEVDGYRFGADRSGRAETGEDLPPVTVPGVPRLDECPCQNLVKDAAMTRRVLERLVAAIDRMPIAGRKKLELYSRTVDVRVRELRKLLEIREITAGELAPYYDKLAVEPLRSVVTLLSPWRLPPNSPQIVEMAQSLFDSYRTVLVARERLLEALRTNDRMRIDKAMEVARVASCDVMLVSIALWSTNYNPRR